MNLSPETVEILKNFSTINQSMLFKQGNVIATISALKTTMATATVDETFPAEFALYDLTKLLSKLSLYGDCDLDIGDDRITFTSKDKRRSDYIKFCSVKVIVTPPEKKLSIGSVNYTFDVSQEDLQWQRKTAGISGSPYMIFNSDGETVNLVSTDVKDDSSDYSKTVLCEGNGSKFNITLKFDNLKMIDGSYTVEISKRGLARFKHKQKELEYFVAIESAQSTFE
jgi:hypothetical protein